MGIRRKKNSGSEIFFRLNAERSGRISISSRMCVCRDTCSLNVFLIKKILTRKKYSASHLRLYYVLDCFFFFLQWVILFMLMPPRTCTLYCWLKQPIWRQSNVVFLIICDVGRFSAVPISGLMISFNLFSWLRAAAASVAINNSWLNYMRNQPDHSYCKVPLGTPFNAGWKRNHHLVVAPKVGDSNDGFFVFVFLSTRRAILASTLQIKITRSVHSPPSIEHAFARWSRETRRLIARGWR